jgi:hypothetical protein
VSNKLIVGAGFFFWALLSFPVVVSPRTWWSVLSLSFSALIFTVLISNTKP